MTEVRARVRQRYAEAALAVVNNTSGGCCDDSCCSPGAEVAEGSSFYTAEEQSELPQEAVLASLGCGNPLAVAGLHEGERVLDLGSGGGIDVLLSARRVGPSGHAYGLDMTGEMLALAEANAEKAGATNVEFLRGNIEAIPLPAVAVVVGSGIAATDRTSDGGLQLLINSTTTALGLAVLILIFGPVSGAHFNPVVTLALRRDRETAGLIAAQCVGAIGGAVLADAMFGAQLVDLSSTGRGGARLMLAEVVATAGLVMLIVCLVRTGRTVHAPWSVGAYIGAAYWFTASTSFANPAVTIGRIFSDTYAGIAPGYAPGLIAAELVRGAICFAAAAFLYPSDTMTA